MMEQDLIDLVEQWLDQTISEEDLACLKVELLANRASLELYVNLTEIHSLLEQSVSSAQSSDVVPMERILRRQKRRSLRTALLASAAVLVLGLITMKLFFVKATDHQPTLAFKTSTGTKLTLTHSGSDQSSDLRVLGNVMEVGSRLQLSQGTVELTFHSGVKSIVIAPADITLQDKGLLYMNQGTGWFHVPSQAVGFQVKTKDLDIVDLGTDFGVLAKLNQHDELHVFKGKVKVSTHGLRRETATLAAGEARRIDPIGRLKIIPAKPDAFLSHLPKTLPSIHWSFDKKDKFQVTGTHPLAADIVTKAYGNPRFSQGKHGSALSLDGSGQYLETDWEGFSGNRPRTVSFWLKIPRQVDRHISAGIIGWGDRSWGSAHKWKVAVVNSQLGAPTYLRLSWGSVWLTSESPLKSSKWQHVIVTSNGKINHQGYPESEFYINGIRQVASYGKDIENLKSLTFKTSTQSQDSLPLWIGSNLYIQPENRRFFNGEIDELTLFDGFMSESQAQGQYQRDLDKSSP